MPTVSATSISVSASNSALTALTVDTGTVSFAGGLSVASGITVSSAGLTLVAMASPAAPGTDKTVVYAKQDGNVYVRSGVSGAENILATRASLSGSAYVDTTDASNITSGVLSANRLPGTIPTLTVTSLTATLISPSQQFVRPSTNNLRFAMGVDSTAESGSNSGSNFYIQSMNDSGAVLTTPLTIYRNSGYSIFNTRVGIGTTSTVSTLTIGGLVTIPDSYGTYLVNSYYDGSWRYAANGVAWGIGNNFSGVTSGVTIATAPVNASGAASLLTWTPTFNISSTGNVGIGTGGNTPAYKLDVTGTIRASGSLEIAALGTAIDSGKNFYPGNQTANYWGWDGSGITKYGAGYTYISSGILFVQATLTVRGSISQDQAGHLTISGGTSGHTYFAGPIGIRTTAPLYGLHVIGSDSGANGGIMIERTYNDTTTSTTFTRGLHIRSGNRALDMGVAGSTYSDTSYQNMAWSTFGGRFGWGAGGSTPTQLILETDGTLTISGATLKNSTGLIFTSHASETAARANYTNMLYGIFTGSDGFRLQVGNRSLGWNGTSSTAVTADNGYVEIASADSSTEPIYVSQYNYATPYSVGTASQAGNAITGSGTTWTNAMVGAEFYFSGAVPPVRGGVIKQFVSTTSLVVDVNQTVASSTYSIGGFFGSLGRRAALLDENGYTSFPVRLGIGTTPTIPLDIVTSDNTTYTNVMTGLASALSVGNSAYFAVGRANSTSDTISLGFYYAGAGNTSNRGDFSFYGGTPVISLLASGNVGIGTTAPAAKLDVAGTLRLNGTVPGTNWTQIQSSATPTTNATYTLPSAVPTVNQSLLISTTGGLMSWATSLSALTVTSLTVSGDLIVSGTFTTYNSVVTTIENPTINIGGGSGGIAPTVDDGYDRGIAFQWHNGTSAKTGFFGFDRSASSFVFVSDATTTSGVVSGSLGSLSSSSVIFSDQSSSPSSPGSNLTSIYSKSGILYSQSGTSGAETVISTANRAVAMAIIFG